MSDLLDKICSDDNIDAASAFLSKKKDSCGTDGMFLSELPDYLAHNRPVFVNSILDRSYIFSLAEKRVILGKTGKKREIMILCFADRLLLRMLYQVLYPLLSPMFADNSYAYIEGCSVQEAVSRCKSYIESGLQYVVELNIKDFFDNISHSKLSALLSESNIASDVVRLIDKYLKMSVKFEDQIHRNSKGVIQSKFGILEDIFCKEINIRLLNVDGE